MDLLTCLISSLFEILLCKCNIPLPTHHSSTPKLLSHACVLYISQSHLIYNISSYG
eukprot:c34928_g1_i1 orf=192-359(-)